MVERRRPLKELITHRFGLDQAVEAYELFDRGGQARWYSCGTKMGAFARVPYRAMKPPSMTSSVPVMNDASSDARKSTP